MAAGTGDGGGPYRHGYLSRAGYGARTLAALGGGPGGHSYRIGAFVRGPITAGAVAMMRRSVLRLRSICVSPAGWSQECWRRPCLLKASGWCAMGGDE
jgi:hypothetical protein